MARKPADERKSEIVMAVLRLADKLGPDRLTTQSIADEVGLTQPGIFRHFATKQALWQAVAELIADKMSAAWQDALSSGDDPRERIKSLILAQLKQIETYPAIPAILFSRELQADNEPLRKALLGVLARFHATITAELADARKDGIIRQDLDPEDGAILLISLVQGLAMRWSLGARTFSMEAEGRRLLDAQIKLFQSGPAGETS